jgi:imidazole glycerol-phosphate synthase subunit HisH
MIVIIDYQMGNLRSVQKGFEKAGHAAVISGDPGAIEAAERVVLPGVGAFEDAMMELRRRQLVGPILAAIDAGKPFLGICLGLQLLFDVSYEDGEHAGLGVIAGEVIRFVPGEGRKVPHMGWNQLEMRRSAPILAGIPDGRHFYFVHSYYVVPRDEGVIAAETCYGAPFCSVIWRDNLFATQFHPEKSQRDGLHILKNFAELSNRLQNRPAADAAT